jgi:hypothetical protein
MAEAGGGPDHAAVASPGIATRASFMRSYEIRSGKKMKGRVVFAAASRPNRREDED